MTKVVSVGMMNKYSLSIISNKLKGVPNETGSK
jgi:hypothetical protein